MIALSNVAKQYGRRVLMMSASFQLNPGEKIGLVGPNGAGKTTLAMELLPDEGECSTFINADLLAAGLNPLQSDFAG